MSGARVGVITSPQTRKHTEEILPLDWLHVFSFSFSLEPHPIHRMVPNTLSTDLTLNLSGNFLKHPLGNGGSLEAREMLPRFRALAVLSEDWISASSMHFGSSSSRGQTPSLGLHGRLHSHARNPHTEHRRHIIHAHTIKTKAGQKRRFSD